MELTTKNLDALTVVATTAAKAAGAIIAEYADKDVEAETKTGGESYASQLVTKVDLLAEDAILQHINPTLASYDIALLTEERTDDKSRFSKDYFWCIDPLDGTLPFIEKQPGYAVSIALISKQGEPVLGVIYDPLTSTLYNAYKGSGVFKNGSRFNSNSQNNSLTLVCDRSFIQMDSFPETEKSLKTIVQKLGYESLNIRPHGGAVMNAMWVIENSPAVYFKFPKIKNGGGSVWDYAASACIFNELGIYASDIYGKPLDLNRHYSTFMNQRGILFTTHKQLKNAIIKLSHQL